jgi:bile acid:Na+ symporter, BASS family
MSGFGALLAQTDVVDTIELSFDPNSILLLNVIIGLLMLGVALGIDLDQLKRTLREPKGPLIGMLGQFVLLPALTFGLIVVFEPAPSVALGMLLVACCPGGNSSNLVTHLAGGNTSLSIGMTAISTIAAIVMTPLNFTFWASLRPDTDELLRSISISPAELALTVGVLLAVPVAIGLLIRLRAPQVADRLVRPAKIFAVVALIGFIVAALANNWAVFVEYIGIVLLVVALHNGLGLLFGYGAAAISGLPEVDRRAVSIEVGMQNSALALGLIFAFYGGLGGMALIAAWWGVWHFVSGLALAGWWSRRPAALPEPASA